MFDQRIVYVGLAVLIKDLLRWCGLWQSTRERQYVHQKSRMHEQSLFEWLVCGRRYPDASAFTTHSSRILKSAIRFFLYGGLPVFFKDLLRRCGLREPAWEWQHVYTQQRMSKQLLRKWRLQ